MPKTKIDFEAVRKIALELPETQDASAHGSLAIKVRGKLMTCVAINKSAEPGSLAIRVDFDQRADLVAAAPDVYYFTDHYAPYPMVLVRLSRINPDALRDLLRASWRFVTATTPAPKRTLRKPRR